MGTHTQTSRAEDSLYLQRQTLIAIFPVLKRFWCPSTPYLGSHSTIRMSGIKIIGLLVMVLVAQALAADGDVAKEDGLYGRPDHFTMEMIRLGTVAAFLVVAAILGVIVWKTCSWSRLV